MTPDCKPTALGSNPADSPAYSGQSVLRWAAIWDGNFTVGCPLRGGRGKYKTKKRTSSPPKTIKEKKNSGIVPGPSWRWIILRHCEAAIHNSGIVLNGNAVTQNIISFSD
jgi:hypothetical protein